MARRRIPTLEELFEEAGLLPGMIEIGRRKGMREGMQLGKQEEKHNIINLLKSGKSAEEIIQLMENET